MCATCVCFNKITCLCTYFTLSPMCNIGDLAWWKWSAVDLWQLHLSSKQCHWHCKILSRTTPCQYVYCYWKERYYVWQSYTHNNDYCSFKFWTEQELIVKVTMFCFVNTYVLRRLVVALKFLDHLDELFINCKILYLCFAFSCQNTFFKHFSLTAHFHWQPGWASSRF